MNSRLILHGIFIVLLWNTQNVSSIFLTSTLMTGLVGGYLLGRMSLGTFLSVLSNNGTRLPSLPSVNFSTILPSFQQLIVQQLEADIENDIPAEDTVRAAVAVTSPTTTSAPVIPTIHYVPYTPPPPPNIPQVYTYNFPVYPSYAYQTTTTEAPFKLSAYPIRPIDVPISLDNKIRDRFIRQLAIMDPLNCLPKIFCEVSADPLRATYITNHGTITNVGSMDNSEISQDEMVAYEYHLHRLRTTTTTTTPKPTTTSTTTTTTESPQNEDEENDNDSGSASEEEADDVSGQADDVSGQSGSSESVESVEDDIDDSFEQYRKEQEHKIEMQALDEMIDDIEDPETYMYILRDKQRRKEGRKKYKEDQRNKLLGAGTGPSIGEGPSSFRQDDLMAPQYSTGYVEPSPLHGITDYNEATYTHNQYLNRRMSVDDGPRPPPPMQPPVFIPPGMKVTTTEPTVHDMFADDPFFNDFASSSGRSARNFMGKSEKVKRRVKRQSLEKADLMKRYRVAYMVAEKFRSPDMCNTVFRSCPYRASTFLSVVNRMESGLLPFQLPSDQKNYFSSKNNINQFKHTLQAIERLNKATFLAQARGEPLDLEEVAETASNPSSNIDASTSQSIVNEFQKVVSKITTAKLKKKKKPKRKKTVKNQTKYDAVHYYKKAQMERLQPKDRLKKGVFHVKEPVKQQDDEMQMHKNLGNVPSFTDTYKEMFKQVKGAKYKSKFGIIPTTSAPTTTSRPKITRNKAKGSKRNHNSNKARLKTTTIKSTKLEEPDEDDEKDAILSEEVVNKLIVKG